MRHLLSIAGWDREPREFILGQLSPRESFIVLGPLEQTADQLCTEEHFFGMHTSTAEARVCLCVIAAVNEHRCVNVVSSDVPFGNCLAEAPRRLVCHFSVTSSTVH